MTYYLYTKNFNLVNFNICYNNTYIDKLKNY